MSSPNQRVHTIESRDIVKEYGELYRDAEESRQRHEDYIHFLSLNPQPQEVEKIIQVFSK